MKTTKSYVSAGKSKLYTGHYQWKGKLWALNFDADDMEDAQARAEKFGIEFAGQIVATIPWEDVDAVDANTLGAEVDAMLAAQATTTSIQATCDAEIATKPYSCEYEHDGSRWGIILKAYDLADAEARLRSIGKAKIVGESVAMIPWEDVRLPRIELP